MAKRGRQHREEGGLRRETIAPIKRRRPVREAFFCNLRKWNLVELVCSEFRSHELCEGEAGGGWP